MMVIGIYGMYNTYPNLDYQNPNSIHILIKARDQKFFLRSTVYWKLGHAHRLKHPPKVKECC